MLRQIALIGLLGTVLVENSVSAADAARIEISLVVDHVYGIPSEDVLNVGDSVSLVLTHVSNAESYEIFGAAVEAGHLWEKHFSNGENVAVALVSTGNGFEGLVVDSLNRLNTFHIEILGDLVPGSPDLLAPSMIRPNDLTSRLESLDHKWRFYELEPVTDTLSRVVTLTKGRVTSFRYADSVPSPNGATLAVLACTLFVNYRKRP